MGLYRVYIGVDIGFYGAFIARGVRGREVMPQ